jgi:hypothetical protein
MIEKTLSNGTIVKVFENKETLIILPDGKHIYGAPQGTLNNLNPEQIKTSCELGYDGNVYAMVEIHDPLHALICDWLGLRTSYSLSGTNYKLATLEEHAVIAVQKFMVAAGGKLPI